MELSPEEYGAYWSASVRIAAGVMIGVFGLRLADQLLSHSEVGPMVLGVVVLSGIMFVATFLAVLGLARVIRTAITAEKRQ